MELFVGSPKSTTDRLSKELRVYELLDSLGIHFMRVDHKPAMTMEACEEVNKALQASMCKNLLLCNRQCTSFYLLMLPGDAHLLCIFLQSSGIHLECPESAFYSQSERPDVEFHLQM